MDTFLLHGMEQLLLTVSAFDEIEESGCVLLQSSVGRFIATGPARPQHKECLCRVITQTPTLPRSSMIMYTAHGMGQSLGVYQGPRPHRSTCSVGRSTLTSFFFHFALVVRSRLAVAAAAAAPPLTVRRRMLPAPRAGSGSSCRGWRRGDASSEACATATLCGHLHHVAW